MTLGKLFIAICNFIKQLLQSDFIETQVLVFESYLIPQHGFDYIRRTMKLTEGKMLWKTGRNVLCNTVAYRNCKFTSA